MGLPRCVDDGDGDVFSAGRPLAAIPARAAAELAMNVLRFTGAMIFPFPRFPVSFANHDVSDSAGKSYGEPGPDSRVLPNEPCLVHEDPPVAQERAMIVEMHCHTAEHSACSHVAAVDLVRRASEVGMQAVVLTDHHYQWSAEELADLRRQAGLPKTFLILAGQEVEMHDFGHVLVYGAPTTIPAMRISLLQIREEAPEAAIIWAHPYRDKAIPDPGRLQDPLLDGVEIFNAKPSLSSLIFLRSAEAYLPYASVMSASMPFSVSDARSADPTSNMSGKALDATATANFCAYWSPDTTQSYFRLMPSLSL
jgi:hypothetical protein